MRIWHKSLIPKLCRQHLLAIWREGLGAYKIITEDKKGYRNHPAVKEFENHPYKLYLVLLEVRQEMIMRGYHPLLLPTSEAGWDQERPFEPYKPWQTLEQQIEILKNKNCECKLDMLNTC